MNAGQGELHGPVAWQRRLKRRDETAWGEWKQCTEAQARYASERRAPEGFEEHLDAEVRPVFVRSAAEFWRNDALEKAATIAARYGADDAAADIRALISDATR